TWLAAHGDDGDWLIRFTPTGVLTRQQLEFVRAVPQVGVHGNAETKTEAIKRFLEANTNSDLAKLYHAGMECQVSVFQGDGEPMRDKYKGREWQGYTKDGVIWKNIRIPWNGNTEPEFKDSLMTWSLEEHCDKIGLSGWQWDKGL